MGYETQVGLRPVYPTTEPLWYPQNFRLPFYWYIRGDDFEEWRGEEGTGNVFPSPVCPEFLTLQSPLGTPTGTGRLGLPRPL